MAKNPRHELMKEARKGHVRRLERLLAAGVDINARGKFGQTALFEAVLSGQTEAIRFLLGRGADSRLVSDDGAGPLHFACVRGDAVIVDLLIQYGASVNEVRRTECSEDDVHTPHRSTWHSSRGRLRSLIGSATPGRRLVIGSGGK